MSVSERERAAEILCEARLAKRRVRELPPELRPNSEADAYAIQDDLHERLRSAGFGTLVGYKIGCTTPVMQQYMNIDHPCSGGVFQPAVTHGFGDFRHGDFVRPGVECELAVRLRSDLGPELAPFDRDSVARTVSACMAAIEVVDDRYVDYSAMETASLVADDFFAAGCVLGPELEGTDPHALATAAGTMTVNGTSVGSGRGDSILGHPLEALAWLANQKASRDEALRAGEFVLLGSIVQTVWVEPGDDVRIVNDPLGEARVRFHP